MFEKYLIAIDIDGTLTNKNHKIPLRTKLFLKKLVKEGHLVVLMSGRPVRAILSYYHELELNTPLVCYNGSLLLSPDDDLKSIAHPFRCDVIKELSEKVRPYFSNMLCETNDHIFIEEFDPILKEYFPIEKMKITEGKIADILDMNPMAVVVRLNEEGIAHHEELLDATKDYDNLEIRFWSKIPFAEFFFKNVSKGNCLETIQKHYNMDKEHTIAVGDSDNDATMFKYAKYKVAMINGREVLKKEATHITKKDNNHAGLVDTLKEILK